MERMVADGAIVALVDLISVDDIATVNITLVVDLTYTPIDPLGHFNI